MSMRQSEETARRFFEAHSTSPHWGIEGIFLLLLSQYDAAFLAKMQKRGRFAAKRVIRRSVVPVV